MTCCYRGEKSEIRGHEAEARPATERIAKSEMESGRCGSWPNTNSAVAEKLHNFFGLFRFV